MKDHRLNLSHAHTTSRARRWKLGLFIVWLVLSIFWTLVFGVGSFFIAMERYQPLYNNERLTYYPNRNEIAPYYSCTLNAPVINLKKYTFEKIKLKKLEICEESEEWLNKKLASAGFDLNARAGLMVGKNLYKIKNKVAEMIDQNANETAIDAYLSDEGVTAEQLLAVPKNIETKKVKFEEVTYIFPVDVTDTEMATALSEFQAHLEELVPQIDIETLIRPYDEIEHNELLPVWLTPS